MCIRNACLILGTYKTYFLIIQLASTYLKNKEVEAQNLSIKPPIASLGQLNSQMCLVAFSNRQLGSVCTPKRLSGQFHPTRFLRLADGKEVPGR